MLYRVALVSAGHQRASAVGVQGPALHPRVLAEPRERSLRRGRAPPALGAVHVSVLLSPFIPPHPPLSASVGLVSVCLRDNHLMYWKSLPSWSQYSRSFSVPSSL